MERIQKKVLKIFWFINRSMKLLRKLLDNLVDDKKIKTKVKIYVPKQRNEEYKVEYIITNEKNLKLKRNEMSKVHLAEYISKDDISLDYLGVGPVDDFEMKAELIEVVFDKNKAPKDKILFRVHEKLRKYIQDLPEHNYPVIKWGKKLWFALVRYILFKEPYVTLHYIEGIYDSLKQRIKRLKSSISKIESTSKIESRRKVIEETRKAYKNARKHPLWPLKFG